VISKNSKNAEKNINYTARRVEGERLAYYRSTAGVAFWDAHWKTYFSPNTYKRAERGHLWQFEKLFTTYLPKKGRILEAGCGLGQYVVALKARGYDIEGVEWAKATVQAVRSLYPDLPIRHADVTNMKVPDNFYKVYISLGVVEHSKAGPQPFLSEAFRVIASDGLALISVPFFHPLRRFKAQMGIYQEQIDGLEFYQYAFTKTEFSHLLYQTGFKIIEYMIYDYSKGIGDEIPLLRWIFKIRGLGWRFKLWIKSREFGKNLGHMILFVCRKE
jgi:SAM-dependent methyltransferase